MLFKSSKQRVREFIAGREREADETFARGCRLPDHPRTQAIAVGVRRTIAKLGQVEPEFIHHYDTFRAMETLPFWNSLDAMNIVMTLERELKVPITDAEVERIPNPDFKPRLTVADFVLAVFEVVRDKAVGASPG